MISQTLLLAAILLFSGTNNVLGQTNENVVPNARTREMEFAGLAKPFTEKFLTAINSNSEAFKTLFQLANYQSPPPSDSQDEQEVAVDHCKSAHRSQATELMLEAGLLFQQVCLDTIKELSPSIDKTVTEFLGELKESSEAAHGEALACSKGDSKNDPEKLLECLRAVVDDHYLPLHPYLDTLAILYEKMSGLLQNMDTCETEVIEIIETRIATLLDEKITKRCVNRVGSIEEFFKTFGDSAESDVETAMEFYLKTVATLREGLSAQMDVVLTRRPLRKMIKVIGKFLENEAQKMIEATNKRVEAAQRLDSVFEGCVGETPAEMKALLDEAVNKLSYCGVSVSKLQYEFDVGLAAFIEKTDVMFASIDKERLEEACVHLAAEDEAEAVDEQVHCIENQLLAKIREEVAPLEKAVADFLYEQFLKYTNMDAHLAVKVCIDGITKDMDEAGVELMKDIQDCVNAEKRQVEDGKDEL